MTERRRKPRGRVKGNNGKGETLTVYFDASDPAERRALAAAQLLAEKHGRRKQTIIALLNAVYQHYEQTGELVSGSAVAAALERGLMVSSMSEMLPSLLPAGQPAMTDGKRQAGQGRAGDKPRLPAPSVHKAHIEFVEGGGKASAEDVGKSFAASINLFS